MNRVYYVFVIKPAIINIYLVFTLRQQLINYILSATLLYLTRQKLKLRYDLLKADSAKI